MATKEQVEDSSICCRSRSMYKVKDVHIRMAVGIGDEGLEP